MQVSWSQTDIFGDGIDNVSSKEGRDSYDAEIITLADSQILFENCNIVPQTPKQAMAM
jgi:hypothetical protein